MEEKKDIKNSIYSRAGPKVKGYVNTKIPIPKLFGENIHILKSGKRYGKSQIF